MGAGEVGATLIVGALELKGKDEVVGEGETVVTGDSSGSRTYAFSHWSFSGGIDSTTDIVNAPTSGS